MFTQQNEKPTENSMLETLLKSVKTKHQEKPITPEAFNKWRTNGVTRRLMEELEAQLIEEMTEGTFHDDPMAAGIEALGKEKIRQTVGQVLNWKPIELVENEDD